MESQVKTWKLTAAQTLALNSAPFTIIPAPGANKVILVDKVLFSLSAGTAFGGIAAGENLEVKYTDNSGVTAMVCETANFLDQTTLEQRIVYPNNCTIA